MLVAQTKKIGACAEFLATLGSDSPVELVKSYRTQDSAECKELAAQTSQLQSWLRAAGVNPLRQGCEIPIKRLK
jgi:hypothetical protein